MKEEINNKKPILVIVGSTSTGKSQLAVDLALKLNGEVISADSRQVYKGLDLGTGKITPTEQQGIPHHLLNVVKPAETFSAHHFRQLAEIILMDIWHRERQPLVAGGTGWYIKNLIDRPNLPTVPPNPQLRSELELLSTIDLYSKLVSLDKTRADNIDKNNKPRLIRAIEIAMALGQSPTLKDLSGAPYPAIYLGLDLPDKILKEKINKRLADRLDAGLIEEVRSLKKQGLPEKRLYDLGLEYRYINWHLTGEMDLLNMIKKLQMAIWHYAKRQRTWFKKQPNIHWLDSNKDYTEQSLEIIEN
ncbi:MAG: tRNA (adenosine(37)-N6)-dimethylallyltransferase MiaA [Patescibacteria group bacterium]